jgi:protein-S-isoprenylcysteine O-methyltransferase Ste14
MEIQSLIIFIILSIPVIYISRKSIFKIRSHGFYRFLSWECILWLLSVNYIFWFKDPFSPKQLLSWFLLIYSIYPAVTGTLQLEKAKISVKDRNSEELFSFEKTAELVQTGIYKYIRHPMYSSLLFLTWGIFFKNTELILFFISLASSIFLFITATMDEKECIAYFGQKYKAYMKGTKMFIPFIF